jgi:hypothetical protein
MLRESCCLRMRVSQVRCRGGSPKGLEVKYIRACIDLFTYTSTVIEARNTAISRVNSERRERLMNGSTD